MGTQRRAIFGFSSDHMTPHPPLYNEPTFRLTRHTNHWKNTAFRDFSNIWRGWIFFLLTFALLHLLSSDFTSSHLLFICFSTLHIVGSLLFKLPSIIVDIVIFTISRICMNLPMISWGIKHGLSIYLKPILYTKPFEALMGVATKVLLVSYRRYPPGKLYNSLARNLSRFSSFSGNASTSNHHLRWPEGRCGEKHILKWKCTKHISTGPLFEVEMLKNCTPLWREAHFQVKMYKTGQVRTTFWSWDVEKLHAAVARSTFSSENVQNMSASDHFLKLRCWKIARRCGEKHIFKWKCTKHYILGALFEVTMSKNCTPLWREAHFQLKILKNWRSRTTFWSPDLEKLHAAVARSIFPSQNVQNTCVLPHFFKFRCRKISQLVN